ncbi:MAG: hypothetical protein KA763_00565 [Xanthomonadales bacterium]|nr:hypothetical protein [Xanthomonadales bacterium]
MKIHHVTDNSGATHLVRAHTIAGARNFVTAKLGQNMKAKVPTQDELVAALQSGIAIEDATAPAGSGDTNSDDQEQTP